MRILHLSLFAILSLVLMGCLPEMNSAVNEQVSLPQENENTVTSQASEWKMYVHPSLGFSFQYPQDWILNEKGKDNFDVVSVMSPEHFDQQKQAYEGGYYLLDFAVSHCESINTDCARGGNWLGVREYADIPDMLKEDFSMKQKSATMSSVMVDGIESYGVISGGFGANYGIMVPHRGIYLLDFPSTETTLSVEQQQILASFRFID